MKFSVLISTYFYDRPDYLDNALRSIWDNQSLKPNQIVLVKDGPLSKKLDDVVSIWEKKLKKKIKVVPILSNVGLGKALNLGLNHCKYDLVARMDSDDISLPERFLKQINFFKNNSHVDILGGWGKIINDKDIEVDKRTQPEHDFQIKKILWACPIIHCSVMFKKNSILKVGSYNPEIAKRQEDYELWIRSGFHQLIFGNIQDYLINYRVNLKKNTVSVCFNRAMIGLKAVKKFDPRIVSYIALFYPLFRSLLPFNFGNLIERLITNSKLDPRRGSA